MSASRLALRLTPMQRDAHRMAAALAGASPSSWARSELDADAASAVLESADTLLDAGKQELVEWARNIAADGGDRP